jgi:ankyrin repeat protein
VNRKHSAIMAPTVIEDTWTALLCAAKQGQFPVLTWLVAQGASLNAQTVQGDNALVLSAKSGHFEMMIWIKSQGIDTSVLKTERGAVALCVAALANQIEIVKWLVQQGVDINAKAYVVPSDIIVGMNMIPPTQGPVNAVLCTALAGHISMMTWLISNGADYLNSQTAQRETPLLLAIKKGHLDLANYLISQGTNFDPQHEVMVNVLSESAFYGKLPSVQWLVTHGVSAQAKIGPEQETALLRAVRNKHFSVVEWLVTQKAVNIQDQNKQGDNALLLATKQGVLSLLEWLVKQGIDPECLISDRGALALCEAAGGGHIDVVKWLILNVGMDVNTKNCLQMSISSFPLPPLPPPSSLPLNPLPPLPGLRQTPLGPYTPLMVAAQYNQLSVVEWLISQSSDINCQTQSGDTALSLATKNHHTVIMEYLRKNGATVQPLTTKDGAIALCKAAREGYLDSIKALLDQGVNVNSEAPAFLYNTAILSALQGGHLFIVEYLITQGADISVIKKEQGISLFCEAAELGRLSVVQWLVAQGVPVDEESKRQGVKMTALLCAANRGQLTVIQWLFSKGASLNHPTSQGDVALLLAARQGHLNVVTWLAEQGTDLSILQSDRGALAFCIAVGANHLEVVKWLVDKGVSVNSKAYDDELPDKHYGLQGYVPALLFAVAMGHLATAQWLVSQGADLNVFKTSKGADALCKAASLGRLSMVKWLITQQGFDINTKGSFILPAQFPNPLPPPPRNPLPPPLRPPLPALAAVNLPPTYGPPLPVPPPINNPLFALPAQAINSAPNPTQVVTPDQTQAINTNTATPDPTQAINTNTVTPDSDTSTKREDSQEGLQKLETELHPKTEKGYANETIAVTVSEKPEIDILKPVSETQFKPTEHSYLLGSQKYVTESQRQPQPQVQLQSQSKTTDQDLTNEKETGSEKPEIASEKSQTDHPNEPQSEHSINTETPTQVIETASSSSNPPEEKVLTEKNTDSHN